MPRGIPNVPQSTSKPKKTAGKTKSTKKKAAPATPAKKSGMTLVNRDMLPICFDLKTAEYLRTKLPRGHRSAFVNEAVAAHITNQKVAKKAARAK